jgi:hypothetical protein
MATATVKNLWTAFITAFFALLAALGLATPATAAARAASATSAAPSESAVTAAQVPAPTRALPPLSLPRGRSLPPTMKQRISAEAHGSSPSVRHLPAEHPADVLPGYAADPAARDLLSESALASAA